MALSLAETSYLIADALRNHDVRAMRRINDRCIEETAIKFGTNTYLFALISYILSKIISKPRYFTQEKSKSSVAKILADLKQCETHAKSANYSSLEKCQNKVIAEIEKMDEKDRRFVKGILQKGRIKIAATLYAQGISLGNAAEIAGIDKRELLLYAGQTMMFDRLKEKKGIEERMKDLREIFS